MPYSGAGRGSEGFGRGSGQGGGYSGPAGPGRSGVSRPAPAPMPAPEPEFDFQAAGMDPGVKWGDTPRAADSGAGGMVGAAGSMLGLPGMGFLGARYSPEAKSFNQGRMQAGLSHHNEAGHWTTPDTGKGFWSGMKDSLNPSNWHPGPVQPSAESRAQLDPGGLLKGAAGPPPGAAPGIPPIPEPGAPPTTDQSVDDLVSVLLKDYLANNPSGLQMYQRPMG